MNLTHKKLSRAFIIYIIACLYVQTHLLDIINTFMDKDLNVSFCFKLGYSQVNESNSILNVQPVKQRRYLGPQFIDHVPNITVAVGRDIVLNCQVKDVGYYKVGWLKSEDQTVISLHKKVVTHNPRIKVTYDEHRTWSLIITDIIEEDEGCYMCQINTRKMMMQTGCVNTLVPPDILNENSTDSDVFLKENDNVSLICQASGKPKPKIRWIRSDKQKFLVFTNKRNSLKKVNEWKGEVLHLANVKRNSIGEILCIASNQVPPSVSKSLNLKVEFRPSIKSKEPIVGGSIGYDLVLTCFVEAYPYPINYWIKNRKNNYGQNDEMLIDSSKYKIETKQDSYKFTSNLRIKNFTKSDKGSYTCISENSIGTNQETILVYAIKNYNMESTTIRLIEKEQTTETTNTQILLETTNKHRKEKENFHIKRFKANNNHSINKLFRNNDGSKRSLYVPKLVGLLSLIVFV